MKKHAVKVVAAGSRRRKTGWRAVCSCGWSAKSRPARLEAGQDAGMHRLEVRYGGQEGSGGPISQDGGADR